ncbi:hypothetical protein [Sphingomonas sp.]|uniref:hypothetical protein n=1 Tax=Sphingomonas sp. TaxID=28214 RepID=UPI001B0EB5CE|nr:hypothetical protein [Sphingomonas sp.]MBO9713744.1 hypothetical protein [Sphingomonas sp.]
MQAGLLLAAALLAGAPPQDGGLRVTDVAESSDGFSCRARELPELRLSHDWRDGDRAASWEMGAREAGGNDMRIRAAFTPDPAAPFGTVSLLMGFQLDFDRTPLRAAPVVAHLRIDGKPDASVLTLEGSRSSVSLVVLERQRADLAQKLMRASIVEIDLVDATAAQLGRFSWDIRGLRRAPELLQILNWSCR